MSDEAIEAAWQEVLEAFDDEAPHKKFLVLCSGLNRLGEAGKRYRSIKEDASDPRSEMAAKQVDRLLGLAMQNLDAIKTPPEQKRSFKTLFFFVAFGVSAALVVSAIWTMMRTM